MRYSVTMTSRMLGSIPPWIKVLLTIWVLLASLGWLVNGGPVRLEEPFDRYQVADHRIPQTGKWVSPAGVREIRRWIETRTHPVIGPATLIWQHFWYNCFTSGYDLVFWLETPGRTMSSYGAYLSGNTLFLRIEPDCWHRVLRTDFTASDVRALFASFTEPIPAEQPVASGS